MSISIIGLLPKQQRCIAAHVGRRAALRFGAGLHVPPADLIVVSVRGVSHKQCWKAQKVGKVILHKGGVTRLKALIDSLIGFPKAV